MPAVLEGEREAVGHAGLAQQPPRLGPAGRDVAPVAGQLLQLGRRRRPRRARHLDARRPPSRRRCATASSTPRSGRAARVSARRTRLSSNGFRSWFIVTSCTQFQGLSCTVIFGPSACTRASRSAGLKPRNWMWARSPRMAATWADDDGDEERAVAVEVGLALVPVVRVLLAHPVRALDVLDELERARCPSRSSRTSACPWPGCRPCRSSCTARQADQERGLRPLEPEAHRLRVGRLDGLDGLVASPCASRSTPAGGKMILS